MDIAHNDFLSTLHNDVKVKKSFCLYLRELNRDIQIEIIEST